MGTKNTNTTRRALYRKYRSKSLDEIVGQGHVTDILKRSLAKGNIAHAYLLTGPRGVGKTSIARILAHEINQLPYTDESDHLDIIEIDAASNNGVDDIRELREKVQIAPVSAKKKIYIIDEVHMLSKPAFNALLKTLEEPPEHVVFILATTDVEKLPATIISRTQRYGFRAITQKDAVKHLRHIAEQESIKIDDAALELIALHGDGSFRDSISLLDQLSSLADDKHGITADLVEQSLGLAPRSFVEQLLETYTERDLTAIVQLLDDAESRGVPAIILTTQLIQTLRSLIVSRPELLELLDQLLEVQSSNHPDIKLLTVLAVHAVPKAPKTAPSHAPKAAAVSTVIPTLEKKALEEHPKEEVPVLPTPRKSAVKPSGVLDWDALVNYTKSNFVAIYSVLSKCSHEVEGGIVTLYTGNAFYKKKLDDSRHRANLFAAMEQIGCSGYDIETIGTPPLPKDSVAASVAAIMGGGEEVSVS